MRMEKTRRRESHQVMKKEHGEGKTEECIQEYKDETKDENEVKEKDMRTITITLDYYQNIIPLHPTADIQTRCKYLDRNLGETSLLPITDEPTLPINETFTYKININCKKDSDHLISSPALLTVLQFAGTCDPGLYEQLQLCETTKHVGSAKSFESIVSIYEALTGDTVDRDIVDAAETKAVARTKKMEKKKEKKGAANKSSKPTKSPKGTSKKQKQKISESISVDSLSLEAKPTTYGMCVIDFLPLFYGKSSFTETLMINPVELFYDERMITYKIRPKITVTISIDKEICFPHTSILNFTVESLFNIPSVMKPDMDYKICAMLPMENSPSEAILFGNPSFHGKYHKNVMKSWPGIKKICIDANTTKYKMEKTRRRESHQVMKKEHGEGKTEECIQEYKDETKDENEVKEKDMRTITITLDYYQNIIPLHPTADIQTRCKYLDRNLGETSLLPITDEPTLPINETFTYKININCKKDSDHLISSPALLTVLQFAGTCDPGLYEQLQLCETTKHVGSAKSFESIVSIYEALTGDTVDRDIVDAAETKAVARTKKMEKKKEKKGAANKSSKPTKSPKGTSKKQKQKISESISVDSLSLEAKPTTYGMCVIDFLPLFYGKSSFTETLMINPVELFYDERMITYKIRPKITVTISIDKEICFPHTSILNFTVESLFNIPSVMKPDMDYKICAMLPMENSPSEAILFGNPSFHGKYHKNVMKSWPGIKKICIDANTTKYKVSEDPIKNTTGIDNIDSCIEESNPVVSFNTLKRNLLLRDGVTAFSHQVQSYRKILLEILVSSKEKLKASAKTSDTEVELSKDKSSTSLWSAKDFKKPPDARKKSQQLHLMAVVDVSSLLYPGVSKIRVASPLTSFNFHEALKETGITDSYFIPKPREPEVTEEVAVPEPEVPKNDKKPEKSKKKEKSSASRYSKSTKKDSKRLSQAKSDLQQLLPLPPEPVLEPEPSTPVYSENGKPTFITVEIELSQPIFKKRDVQDLENELQSLLEDKKDSSHKVVLTTHVSKDYYKAVLNQITKDIYDKYKQYTSLKEKESSTVAEKDFIKYLESVGAYQTYLTSIKEAISVVITTKFHINETDKKNSHLYQNFIGEVFVYLVSEMNDTLNRLVCTGLQPVVTPKPKPADKLYFYAKEAAALGKRELADRYYLEIICYNESQNPDSWFDYAVFNLEIKQPDRAYECVLLALEKQRSHRYSLLLLGIMLADKGQRNEAETCFLNLIVYQPRWVEGWVALFLFYKKIDKYEGMDMAMDMVKKYLDDERTTSDYFSEMEDLLWTSKICPKTMFFRTAVLLLKMRVYEWVEMALVQEVQGYFGITHYLLSAVCLYQELYEQALEHIQLTKAYCGPDYAVSSLSGHCLYALSRLPEAQEDYYHVLESLDRPDDIHMVYINCAQILDDSRNRQDARKLILLACKHSPTHYTWYRAGLLYLQDNDLLSAEECFSEANFKDNRCPEYWGYLTIINLKLNRLSQAELCYSQALKNNLDDAMCEEIRKEFKKCSTEV